MIDTLLANLDKAEPVAETVAAHSAEFAEQIAAAGYALVTLHRPDRVVCRYVRPWNEPYPGARDIHDWDEFVALVNRIWC